MSRRPPIFPERYVNIGGAVTFEAPKFADIRIRGWVIKGKAVRKSGEYEVCEWSAVRIARYRRTCRIARRFSWLPRWAKRWLRVPEKPLDYRLVITNNAVLS